MLVCCFHTGGPYRDEAERLRESLERCGVQHRIDEVPSRGSWDANVCITPDYIREVMNSTAQNVLYLDADAVMHSVPVFDPAYDIACHYLRGWELLDGTLWLNNNNTTRDVVRQWCEETTVGVWEQKTLQDILDRRSDVRVNRLPPEYCYIFDTSRALHPGVEPIIEHMQASRRLKDEVSDAS